MRAMLDVFRRPEAFGCRVVAFVEESVEGFENDRLVLFRCCLCHVRLLGFLTLVGRLGNRNTRATLSHTRFPNQPRPEGRSRPTSGPGRGLRCKDGRMPP